MGSKERQSVKRAISDINRSFRNQPRRSEIGRELPVTTASKSMSAIVKQLRQHRPHNSHSIQIYEWQHTHVKLPFASSVLNGL